jgi:hypothetical protein
VEVVSQLAHSVDLGRFTIPRPNVSATTTYCSVSPVGPPVFTKILVQRAQGARFVEIVEWNAVLACFGVLAVGVFVGA